jgi:hypothetical protein
VKSPAINVSDASEAADVMELILLYFSNDRWCNTDTSITLTAATFSGYP